MHVHESCLLLLEAFPSQLFLKPKVYTRHYCKVHYTVYGHLHSSVMYIHTLLVIIVNYSNFLQVSRPFILVLDIKDNAFNKYPCLSDLPFSSLSCIGPYFVCSKFPCFSYPNRVEPNLFKFVPNWRKQFCRKVLV